MSSPQGRASVPVESPTAQVTDHGRRAPLPPLFCLGAGCCLIWPLGIPAARVPLQMAPASPPFATPASQRCGQQTCLSPQRGNTSAAGACTAAPRHENTDAHPPCPSSSAQRPDPCPSSRRSRACAKPSHLCLLYDCQPGRAEGGTQGEGGTSGFQSWRWAAAKGRTDPGALRRLPFQACSPVFPPFADRRPRVLLPCCPHPMTTARGFFRSRLLLLVLLLLWPLSGLSTQPQPPLSRPVTGSRSSAPTVGSYAFSPVTPGLLAQCAHTRIYAHAHTHANTHTHTHTSSVQALTCALLSRCLAKFDPAGTKDEGKGLPPLQFWLALFVAVAVAVAVADWLAADVSFIVAPFLDGRPRDAPSSR